MIVSHNSVVAIVLLLSSGIVSALPWSKTEYMFVFGDSYSADGYNVTAGVNSPDPGYTSSNGRNWVEFLASTYNSQTTLKTFDLASGGATIDASLVPPYTPSVLSVVEQVGEFSKYLASKPAGATWDSTNSLFAIWVGINDVGNSFGWSNVSRPEFYVTLMDRLFSQVDSLYSMGARSFLFLTVPPINRAPIYLEQGTDAAKKMGTDIAEYNSQLEKYVHTFQKKHSDIKGIVFDTQPVFNVLLDNGPTLGFVNITGYCVAYQTGTPTPNYQVEGCAPVSSYFWLNYLHPLFTVHSILAKAIATALSGYYTT